MGILIFKFYVNSLITCILYVFHTGIALRITNSIFLFYCNNMQHIKSLCNDCRHEFNKHAFSSMHFSAYITVVTVTKGQFLQCIDLLAYLQVRE
jgi:hypothetical protein